MGSVGRALTKLLFLTVGELGERNAKKLFPYGWGAGEGR